MSIVIKIAGVRSTTPEGLTVTRSIARLIAPFDRPPVRTLHKFLITSLKFCSLIYFKILSIDKYEINIF